MKIIHEFVILDPVKPDDEFPDALFFDVLPDVWSIFCFKKIMLIGTLNKYVKSGKLNATGRYIIEIDLRFMNSKVRLRRKI